MMTDPHAGPQFDQHAARYDDELEQGLGVSGESGEFFAKGRIEFLARCCKELEVEVGSVLDFGCGTGGGTRLLATGLSAQSVVGLDESAASLEIARRADSRTLYLTPDTYTPDGSIDLAYTNGVFHHIPVAERRRALEFIAACLGPGGVLSFWENNPLNPGTRYVMSRIPFDRDAVTLRAREARALLETNGFEVLHTTYHFIFPRALKFLRPLEVPLKRVPLGAQYQVFCRKR